MPDTWEQVTSWRNRALEVRTAAEGFTSNSSAKETMLSIAATYERLADDLERRLKRTQDVKSEAS